jgi:glycosyltransferase involved in cell wall biosynthesis
VTAIAQHHEVWVLTAGYHRSDLEEALRREPEKPARLHFLYVEEKQWHYRPTRAWIRIENSIAKPIMNWAYRFWLRDAFALASRVHHEIRFDLVHQVTYVGFRFPGHLWKLGVPFVWGPIGGLENVPWRLLPAMGPSGMAQFACRNVVNTLHKRFLRQPKKAFCAARGGIIAATTSIQREIKRYYDEESTVIAEVGPPRAVARTYSRRSPQGPLRLCWSGLHLPRKAFPLLLSALALVPRRVNWTLDILGSGACTRQWRRRAERLGVGTNCRWLGQLSRDEAVRRMRESHIFVITSLQDLTSTVLVEALALGLPVLCPDHCGFVDAVDQSCGVRIRIGAPDEFITGLARAIEQLHDNERLRQQLAVGALVRARAFSWEQKSAALERIYQRVVEARGQKLVEAIDMRAAKSL